MSYGEDRSEWPRRAAVYVDRDGRLARAGVVGGQGASVLQAAALGAVRDATPLAFPAGVAPRPLTIRLPVVFELR